MTPQLEEFIVSGIHVYDAACDERIANSKWILMAQKIIREQAEALEKYGSELSWTPSSQYQNARLSMFSSPLNWFKTGFELAQTTINNVNKIVEG